MQKMHNHYEYACLYVDNVTIFSKKPQAIITALEALYDMKAIGQPEYYNGADFYKEDNHWCILAKIDLKNMCEKIEKSMDANLKNHGSLLEPGDHPEMDETEFLTGNDISQYQMLVRSTQWAITLGR
jgi:hypothetical protein